MAGSALLVIDMQEHFRTGAAERIVKRINCLIDACAARDVPIFFTQHGHPKPVEEEKTNVLVHWWGAENSIKCVGLQQLTFPTPGISKTLFNPNSCTAVQKRCAGISIQQNK